MSLEALYHMIIVYSRQIAMLESSSERQEQRLRAENECLEREYQAKITRMQVCFSWLCSSSVCTPEQSYNAQLRANLTLGNVCYYYFFLFTDPL